MLTAVRYRPAST